MRPHFGNLHMVGERMTLEDLVLAVEATHEDDPQPPNCDSSTVAEIVKLTYNANHSIGRRMGYGAILAWGIAIGVRAERRRALRESNR